MDKLFITKTVSNDNCKTDCRHYLSIIGNAKPSNLLYYDGQTGSLFTPKKIKQNNSLLKSDTKVGQNLSNIKLDRYASNIIYEPNTNLILIWLILFIILFRY